jgi:hypothetical protein
VTFLLLAAAGAQELHFFFVYVDTLLSGQEEEIEIARSPYPRGDIQHGDTIEQFLLSPAR